MSQRRFLFVAIAIIFGALIAIPILWFGLDMARYRQIQVYNVHLDTAMAFTDGYTFNLGEPVPLYVHGESTVTGEIYRLGATKELVASDIEIGAAKQNRSLHLKKGFDWDVTHRLNTEGLRPGLHTVELYSSEEPSLPFIVPFVISAEDPEVAVFISTNTWEAYNDFGGISNYENHHFSGLTQRILAEVEFWGGQVPDIDLPWARPNNAISNDLHDQLDPTADFHSRLIRQEWAFLAFLEFSGLDYGIYTDRDLAFGDSWKGADLIVFPGHAEYWSDEMFHAFDQYVASGGHALLSAGNPMLKPVEFEEGFTAFQQTEIPSDRIRRMIGATFTGAGIFTAAPFEVLEPDHWVFEGLGIREGDTFGHHSITRPVVEFNDPTSPEGASGLFTLEPGFGSTDFIELAVGLNDDGPAHMMFMETPAGGWVFNSGSGSFTGALFDDPIAIGLVKNLIKDALGQ